MRAGRRAGEPRQPVAAPQVVPYGIPSVVDLCAALCRRDGPFHVGARYFANLSDAAVQRRWYAERLHAAARRGNARAVQEVGALVASVRRVCVWCGGALAEGAPVVDAGYGHLIHRKGCLNEFEVFVWQEVRDVAA